MEKRVVKTDNAPTPGGWYSQAITAGDLVFTAGMVGTNPKTGETPKGVGQQTKQALQNLKAALEAAGSDLSHVVRANVYLRHIEDFDKYNKAYQPFFPKDPPARTTVQAKLFGKYLVEINLIAVIPDK